MFEYNVGVELLTCYHLLQHSFIQRLDAIANIVWRQSWDEGGSRRIFGERKVGDHVMSVILISRGRMQGFK